MSACKLVTVKKIIPLFKGNEKANNICLVELEEIGNKIVSGINSFKVGDTALFIEPDYCIPDTPIFEEYYRPYGNSSKCKLGNNGRIRAIKFNLHTGDDIPVYSYGILMPLIKNLSTIINANYSSNDITIDEILGIYKYEEPEKCENVNLGGKSQEFPKDMYKTDETNINNLWRSIKYPITLIGTQKIDGSSITIFSKKVNGEYISGICSRNQLKPLKYNKIVGQRKKTFRDILYKVFTRKYPNLNIIEEVESDNEFVKIGKPYLESLEIYCKDMGLSIALRGELNGKGLRGSGNKNNPSVKEEPNIKFYAADDYSLNSERLDEEFFNKVINDLGFERCKKYFTRKMRCKKDIINRCEQIFAQEKSKGNIIEGIVLKTPDGKFSAKYMNLEYDSKK